MVEEMLRERVLKMTKPINFRPKASDQPIIDLLMETGEFKNASDLVRAAVWQLALQKFGEGVADHVGLEMAQQLVKKYEDGGEGK